MLAQLILCVEHKARVMLPEYIVCEMSEIIEQASGQSCQPGEAMRLAGEIAMEVQP